jgi:hypothetical protein
MVDKCKVTDLVLDLEGLFIIFIRHSGRQLRYLSLEKDAMDHFLTLLVLEPLDYQSWGLAKQFFPSTDSLKSLL